MVWSWSILPIIFRITSLSLGQSLRQESSHLPLVPYIYMSMNRDSIGSDNDLSPMLIHFPQDIYILFHCGLVMPYGDIDSVNIVSGNGLLSAGCLPAPSHYWNEWNLYIQLIYKAFSDIHLRANLKEIIMNSIHNMRSEITLTITTKTPRVQWVKRLV